MLAIFRSFFLILILIPNAYASIVYITSPSTVQYGSFSAAKSGYIDAKVPDFSFFEDGLCDDNSPAASYCYYRHGSNDNLHGNFRIFQRCKDTDTGQLITYDSSNPLCEVQECDPESTQEQFKEFINSDGSMTNESELEQYKVKDYCGDQTGVVNINNTGACKWEQKDKGLLTANAGGGVVYMSVYKMTGTCDSTPPPNNPPSPPSGNNHIQEDDQTMETPDLKAHMQKENCGTLNGQEICVPLVESNQQNSEGKDLLTVPDESQYDEMTQGLELIAQIAGQQEDSKPFNVFNAPANSSNATKGTADNGSGKYTPLTIGGDSGSGSGSGAGTDTGTTNDILKGIAKDVKGDETKTFTNGTYDTSGLDGEIQALKTQIKGTINSIRVEANQLFTNNQNSNGSLYCDRNIALIQGQTFDICLDDYRDQLSIIGTFILAISLIMSVYILLKG